MASRSVRVIPCAASFDTNVPSVIRAEGICESSPTITMYSRFGFAARIGSSTALPISRTTSFAARGSQ